MPSVEWNKTKWGNFSWPKRGEEWSVAWGSASVEWSATLFPRIFSLLPVREMVEIAPGYGRWTSYLLDHCEHLTAVDLNPNCVAFCEERFAPAVAAGRCRFVTNDGFTLPGVADESVDLVFSFDSLVHVEQDVIDGYLSEAARVLRDGGHAFLHHSNLADLTSNSEGTLGRGVSVGASTVRAAAEARGLQVRVQERITWQGTTLRDCITLLTKRPAQGERLLIENEQFWRDVDNLRTTIHPYHQVMSDDAR
jgi:SAM-dependent methyltransferase